MSQLRCSDFAQHVLGLSLWAKQKEILNDLFENKINHAVWCLGRRSSKSTMAAIAAIYTAFCQEDYFRKKVRKGEKYYVITVANDLKQAKIALDFIRQMLTNSPLEQEITRETALDIELTNGCVFQAIPASARASRGKAVAMAIFDECAFGLDGDANRGTKALFDAISPSVAQFAPHSKILELSSPWLADGLFFDHFNQAESGEFKGMSCRKIATWDINPGLPWGCDFLENARKKDEEAFRVEFGAEFRRNNSSLVAAEIIDAAVNKDRTTSIPQRELMGSYVLALDPARGGKGRDAYVACIVHYEGERLIVDKFHEFLADFEIAGKKEVNIAQVEYWIAEQHRMYDFESISLDQYNSASTIQSLSKSFPICELTWSVSTKMRAFGKLKELLNSGLIELPYHKEAIKQLKNLGVIYRQSGQWSVTGGKESSIDDYCFALAAAILQATKEDSIDWINSLIR
jgi:hypothetical protein